MAHSHRKYTVSPNSCEYNSAPRDFFFFCMSGVVQGHVTGDNFWWEKYTWAIQDLVIRGGGVKHNFLGPSRAKRMQRTQRLTMQCQGARIHRGSSGQHRRKLLGFQHFKD